MKARLLVSFPSGDLALRGHLYLPDGPSRFPAVVWNHGSERLPRPPDELGRFYTSAGYALFAPHRHGHGLSPGEYSIDSVPERARRLAQNGGSYRCEAIGLLIELHEAEMEDTIAAVSWLSKQACVDATRMAMSGVSHGAIQVLLAAEAGAGTSAYVPFAPAAMAWRGNPELQHRLLSAVWAADAPIFLVQAENDYCLGPSELLGNALRRKGGFNRARVYPPFGSGRASGHAGFACQGTGVWGTDVRAFLNEVCSPVRAAA